MARWGDEKTLNFIFHYRNHECLWNVRSPLYKNKFSRENAYQSLLESLNDENLNLKSVKTKIKNLRSIYHTELRKVKDSKRSRNDGLVYKPSLSWFEEMHSFLGDFVDDRETILCSEILSSGDTNSEFPEQETNEDFDHNFSDSSYNNSSSILNNSNLSTQSSSEKSLQANINLQSARKNSRQTQKQNTAKTKFRHKISSQEDDSILNTLQRLESISRGLITAQHQSVLNIQDEFYFFGLSVAAQLRNLPLAIAIETQSNIQNTLSAARLSAMAASTPSPINCQSSVCDQSYSAEVQEVPNAESYIKIEENKR